MTIQQNNAELVGNLSAHFARRNEPNVAWGNALSLLALPALRGLWLMGSREVSGNVIDHSGQGRALTNVSSLTFGVNNNFWPYSIHDGSADLLRRTDEAGLDITEGLTWGGWFYSNATPGSDQGLMTKYTAGSNNRSYALVLQSTPRWEARVSSAGTAATEVTVASSVTYAATTWTHIVGRFTPSTELAIFVDGTKDTNTTSIPATIFNSGAPLEVGSMNVGGNVLAGRATLCFLCATALPDTLIQMLLYQQHRAIFGR